MIDTALRQWCGRCQAATISKRCIYPPNVCCSQCCNRCDQDDDSSQWPD